MPPPWWNTCLLPERSLIILGNSLKRCLLPGQTLPPTIQRWHQLRTTCRRGFEFWLCFQSLTEPETVLFQSLTEPETVLFQSLTEPQTVSLSRFLRLILGGGESSRSVDSRLSLMRLYSNFNCCKHNRNFNFGQKFLVFFFHDWMWLWLKVVVTAPVPQILQLGGGVHDRIQQQPQLLQQLEKVDRHYQLQSCSSFSVCFPTNFFSFDFN